MKLSPSMQSSRFLLSCRQAHIQAQKADISVEAATGLTRIFGRLRKHGKMTLPENIPNDSQQSQIVRWINARYDDFIETLIATIKSDDENLQVVFLLTESLIRACVHDPFSTQCQGRDSIRRRPQKVLQSKL